MTYLGPALVAGVIIGGWWAHNEIKLHKENITLLETQTTEFSLALANQCKPILERQGFVVTEVDEEVEVDEKDEADEE